MSRKLVGGKVTFRAEDADGTSTTVPWTVKEGTKIIVTREYADGHQEERQIFPQNTGYQPVKPPWKDGDNKQ